MYVAANNTGKIIKKNTKTEKDKNVQKVAGGLSRSDTVHVLSKYIKSPEKQILTNSGDGGAILIQHSHVLRQQQLRFRDHCQNAQDIQSVPHCVSPETHSPEERCI